MRPLCDRISGDPRGARGFGSYRKNCRSGRLLPRTATRVCASRIGASRKHAVRQKRRSTSYGGQIVRRHPKSGPVQNTVTIGTRQFGAIADVHPFTQSRESNHGFMGELSTRRLTLSPVHLRIQL
jgi:hypothetical protein